eukprot:GFYU01000105.1.p1 GENE.GFYU01000105.1~~GFYU01000105.1.p1  ORF type:complete len:311 (-),score=121.57 GFYU01000105.1:62-994(-)
MANNSVAEEVIEQIWMEDYGFDQSEDIESEALRAFRKYDRDHSNTIDSVELWALLDDLGLLEGLTEEQEDNVIDKEFAVADLNRDNQIQFDEFVQYYNNLIDWRMANDFPDYVSTKKNVEKRHKRTEDDAHKAFLKFDKDKSGSLERDELQQILNLELKLDLTEEQFKEAVDLAMEAYDFDSSGRMEYPEFLEFFRVCLASKDTRRKYEKSVQERYEKGKTLTMDQEDEVYNLFGDLDTDGSGTIAGEELKSLLTKMELPATADHVTMALEMLDINKDGSIDFDEFRQWVIDYWNVDEQSYSKLMGALSK